MWGLTDFRVDFLTDTPVLVALALAVLLVLSWFLYRRTNPPLPLYLRAVLTGLRLIAVLALMLALSEPMFSFSRNCERRPRLAVLLDESSSMDKEELERTRRARRDSLLSSDDYGRLQTAAEVTTYYFGGSLSENQREVQPQSTALGDILQSLSGIELAERSDYWLLFTDGRSNAGRDPAQVIRGGATPVLAVDMAAPSSGFDIALDDVDFNPVVFAGQSSELRVRLGWDNAEGKRISVLLQDSSRTAAREDMTLSQEVGRAEVVLRYTPGSPGQKILRVQVPAQEGEQNTNNNSRSFSVNVLKNRLSVLLVTSRPNYDVGWLRRFLRQSEKYDVELLSLGPQSGNLSGRFPSQQSDLNRFDLVILHDPDPQLLAGRDQILRSYLAERGGSLWVMLGEQFAARGPVDWFDELLPFRQGRRQSMLMLQFHGVPEEGNLFHPSVRLDDNQARIRDAWQSVPPFRALVPCPEIDPAATLLVYADLTRGGAERLPVLAHKRIGAGKVLASSAQPFWTWGFLNLGIGHESEYFSRFVEGTVSWLTVSDDLEPIRILPERRVFTRGEPVAFDGYAFDLGFRPIPDVRGVVTLTEKQSGTDYEADLIATGDGEYEAQFFSLPPGTYRYVGTFEKDGQQLRRQEGEILIESFSLEEYDQRPDPVSLQAVARLSGGKYATYDQFGELVAGLDLTPITLSETGEIPIWNKFWLLLIFIAALSAEWFLRKLYQLL